MLGHTSEMLFGFLGGRLTNSASVTAFRSSNSCRMHLNTLDPGDIYRTPSWIFWNESVIRTKIRAAGEKKGAQCVVAFDNNQIMDGAAAVEP